MVLTHICSFKKEWQPRCSIDLQRLNALCQREFSHTSFPFYTACRIPPETKKTVLDAVDEYHAIIWNKKASHLPH